MTELFQHPGPSARAKPMPPLRSMARGPMAHRVEARSLIILVSED